MAGQATAGATGQQFYVTHCVTADSVMNAPGYSVRAATDASNPGVLRLALEYPPYELPLELWRERPAKAMAPRRLTRTNHPQGGVWVVHSVYLEKDTMNRDRSYFSHLLQLPSATDAAAVLRSWDAPGWVKEYPTKADKKLPLGRLPVGTAVSDNAITAFLSGPVAGPTDLAAVVCPARLREDVAARKELVLRFLQGVVRVLQEDGDRDRLFVHAEPGLVALLLYAATRLLPPAWTGDLTFSTFEPAHRGLRDYTLATIVGTYTGPGGKGLDPELASARGYGIDTFRADRSSRELAGAHPPGLAELIDLASRGEWDLLGDVHRFVGGETDALSRVSRTVPLARAVARFKSGKPTVDDLIALKTDARGATILAQNVEKAWPFVSEAALAEPRVRAAFKDWLAEPARLDEFRRDAARAILKEDMDGWEERWTLMREVAAADQARDQLSKVMKNLDEHLPELPLLSRQRLREACAGIGLFPDHHLLAANSQDELTALLDSRSPPDWQGYACFAVMGPDEKNWLLPATAPFRPALRDRVRRHLLGAPPAVLAGYLKQARPFISTDPDFLYHFLKPFSKNSVTFLDRVIDAGAAIIEAPDWIKLLQDLDVYNGEEWQGFLFKNDHLAKLLAGFRKDPVATKLWADYLDLLSLELFEDDEWELTLYHQLRKAAEGLGKAGIPLRSVLPEGGAAKLNAIDHIFSVISNPASASGLEQGELLGAFQSFWPQEPLSGMLLVYKKGAFDQLELPRESARLEQFATVFLACYPITAEYYSIRTAVAGWLALSLGCPDAYKAEFQLHLLRKHVLPQWYRNLLEEERRVPFAPGAEARLKEAVAAQVSQSGYVRPASAKTSSDENDMYASAATKRARKYKGSGQGGSKKKGSGGLSGGTWAVIVVGVVCIVLGIVAVRHFTKGQTKTDTPQTQQETDKTDTQKKEKK